MYTSLLLITYYPMKTYSGFKIQLYSFLMFGTRLRRIVSFILRASLPRKEMSRTHSRSRRRDQQQYRDPNKEMKAILRSSKP
jgi:hypothetical protein